MKKVFIVITTLVGMICMTYGQKQTPNHSKSNYTTGKNRASL